MTFIGTIPGVHMRSFRVGVILVLAAAPILAAGQVPRIQLPGAPPGPQPVQRPDQQEPVATFRAGVRAIQIDAVVTDAAGNPVRGLTEADFEILEKGRPQPITTFEAVDIPIEAQLPDLADADVVTNEGDGRIYLIVIDSISVENAPLAKRELRQFFAEHFGPSDTAAIMFLDKAHSNAGQDFTSNRRLLIKGVDSIIGDEPVVPGSASPFGQTLNPSAALLSRNRMSRLKDLTEFLNKVPGRRKAMLLVSEAIGFDANDFKDYAGTIMTPAAQDAHAAMTAATRGNIAIYPINPAGLSPDSPGVAPSVGAPPTAAELEGVQAQRLMIQSATLELRTVAAATGGFALVNSNNFGDTFTRLVQENSVYYMLGFNSAQEKDDGRYVPVQVRVKRPGLKVLAKEGYIAPFKGKDSVTSPERNPGVGSALASPIPVGGVTLRAFAAPFKGKGKTASVLVALAMDPNRLGLMELPDGGLRGSIDVRMVATDVRAKVLPQIRQVGNITIPAQARGDVARDGLHLLTKTDLQPGRYQLRIAIGTAQRGGSVIYDVEVPDYSKKDVAMSGVVLRGGNDPEGVFLPTGDPLEALKVRAPTTARVFSRSDRVTAYAEIYDTTGGKPHTVEARAVLRSEAGEVTPIVTASRSTEELKKTGDMLRFETPLPLNGLSAGRYVFALEVKSSAGGDSITRTIPFRVR
jgi:VWFA-related protein